MFYLLSSSDVAYLDSHVTDSNNHNKFLTAKLLKQGYRYHKLPKAFLKYYRRHFELIENCHVSLKTLMQQGICNPEFYGDLVYKSNRKAMNRNWNNQKANPALKTKAGNK